MRLSKTNIFEAIQNAGSNLQNKTASAKAVSQQSPAIALIIIMALAALAAPTVSQTANNTESVEIIGQEESAPEGDFENQGEATIIIDGVEVDPNEVASEEAASNDEGQTTETSQNNGSTVISINSSVSSSTGESTGSGDEADPVITVNGEEVEVSRTGRFKIEDEHEFGENEVSGDIDIDTDSDTESNASVNITINGQ